MKNKSNQNNLTRNFGDANMNRGSSKVIHKKINYDDHFEKNEKVANKGK
tara:strand:+ start:637 stop:783 length:147 start_codon:yes stop_codon:yes gene_type:complete